MAKKMAKKMKSILETVHETAEELHDAGVMDTKTMREFDALCLPAIKEYNPGQIKLKLI